MDFKDIMGRVLPNAVSSIDSPFYRLGGPPNYFVPGSLHRGIDFNYVNPALNTKNGQTNVYAPISGTIERTDPEFFGEVTIIRNDPNDPAADQTVHRIIHLNTIDAAFLPPNLTSTTTVQAGQLIGTMGGRVAKRNQADTAWIAQGNLLDAHVHYEVYLPDANGWSGISDNRVNANVYWSTGLQTSSIALSGLQNDGTYNTQGILKESTGNEWTQFNVNINTPHTKDLIIRVQFDVNKTLVPDRIEFQPFITSAEGRQYTNGTTSGSKQYIRSADSNGTNVLYLTLPATPSVRNSGLIGQLNPNTSFSFGLRLKDDDILSFGTTTMTMEAGYLENQGMPNETWVPYKNFKKVSQTVFLLDNDTPTIPTFTAKEILTGNELDNATFVDTYFSDLGVAGGGVLGSDHFSYSAIGAKQRVEWQLQARNKSTAKALYGFGG